MGKMNKSKKIIFVDNLTSINEIENFSNQSDVKIISFDYTSHIKLTEKNIEHEISEIYLTQDTDKLQKQCYEFLNWYNLDVVKKNTSFLNINISKLYNDQLIHEIIKILKKFSEIKVIVKQFPNSKYFASGDLLLISKLWVKSTNEIPNNQKMKFYFDHIEIGTNIGKKNIKISIPNSLYKKIKNIIEKVLESILQNENLSKKNTLLVEFNTKKFKKFFLESKNYNKNIAYYGRRRPGIWDLESFKIIKNSQCKIITSNIMKGDILKTYKKNILEIKEKYLELLNSNKELNKFFSIDDISFISVISPIIKLLIIDRLEEIIFEILLAKQMFEGVHIDSVVVLSEIGMTEQIIIQLANQKKIPILHLQEGLHYDTQEAFEHSKFQTVFLESASKYIAWGKFSKEFQVTIGKISTENVIELGSPYFSELNFLDNQNSEEYVLLATMPPQIEQINGINVKNLEKYLKSILKICEIISTQKKKMIIKLHPTSDILNISKTIQEKFPDIIVIEKGDIDPLIRKCSILIVTGISTVIVQGQILQKPVISIPLIDYNWGKPSAYTENSCLLIELEQLSINLKKIYDDPLFKNKLIDDGNKFLKNCFKNKDNSSKIIWEYIKNLTNN
tara:strand:- start:237 stop:2093 length:1857 start_codon:yes stop_codon:yes gene_type:complete